MAPTRSVLSNPGSIVALISIATAVGAWAIVGYQARDTTDQFRVHCYEQTKKENELAGTLSEVKTELRAIKEQNDRIEKFLNRVR